MKQYIHFISIVAAISGVLFGYDAGIISGALLFIKNQMPINSQQTGFIVSAVPIGAFFSALFIGRISDKVGRKKILIITALLFTTGSLLCGISNSIQSLIFGRLLLGLAVGLSSSSAPLYISEITQEENRGKLVTLYLIAVNGGLLIAYITNYLLSSTGAWRIMLLLGAFPACILGLLSIFLPESPRWLVSVNQTKKASLILEKIHGAAKAKKEMVEILQVLKQERFTLRKILSSQFVRILFLGIIISIFTQAVGINAIIYYAPTIFQKTGFNEAQASILATVGIGFTVTLAAVIAAFFIDRVGRRKMLLTGLAGIIISLIVIIIAFNYAKSPQLLGWSMLLGSILFVLCQGLSVGPACFLLPSEIFPAKIRGTGMGISIAFNWLTNSLVAFLFPLSLDHFGVARSFSFFLVSSIVGWVLFCYFVPETKNISLEKIELNLLQGVKLRDLGKQTNSFELLGKAGEAYAESNDAN